MQNHPHSVDCVIDARWVIPVEPRRTVLEHHSVAIKDGTIVDLMPSAAVSERYLPQRRIALAEHALIPGLVNLHTHAAMTLMRGLADDQALMDWLQRHIWPVETRLASPEFVHDGTLLACAEMLRGGVTCFNDMYFFPEAAAQAVLGAGMRAALGMIVIEFRSPYANDAADYLSKGLAMRDSYRDEPRLSFCIAPHAPFTVSDATFERVATYAGELDVPVHIHLHETADEIRDSLAAHNLRPIRRLQELGLLGPGLIAVHAVHLEADEIVLLAEHGCHVAHCPSSNLKLASGIAPVAQLHRHGVNVGLGTDGAASNNRLDIFTEMRLAALLAKGSSGDPTVLPAHAALEMATLNAARALGLDQRIGSLSKGKRADIVAVNLAAPELAPCYDPLSHLAYAAGREHVSHVWVDGELLVDNGAFTRIDARELTAKAAHWKEKIRSQD
ncbi:MAG: N-ethylammeline chlorohydrolase [Betaproteobacteria bacterium RIFCSPLOWO2_12_FULL_62_58]|nr:MAG: N-ethylammeline chlorohydrolase [Betaproteobacteria bacterium RIFCSPLOWO2_12_FULL_62_58]